MILSEREFSVRGFLRERKALLVHFSTCMSCHESEYLFPEDLRNAQSLVGKSLSFSTILQDDVGPFDANGQPNRGNAAGCIGIVVDIRDDCVVTVGQSDDGTSFDNKTGEWISGGKPPAPDTCAESIDARADTNEWFVRDYTCIGIFYFYPGYARARIPVSDGMRGNEEVVADVHVTLGGVLARFPNDRIFTAHKGAFCEFDCNEMK